MHPRALLAEHLTAIGHAPAAPAAPAPAAPLSALPPAPPLHTLISAHDFEAAARQTFTPKAWAFASSAATDCITAGQLHAAAFARVLLRPRVLRDVAAVHVATRVLGCATAAPFFVAPTSMHALVHAGAEAETARGAARAGLVHVVSGSASLPLAAVAAAAAPAQPLFLQLYVSRDRAATARVLREARARGFRAVVVTVDAPVMGKREADERAPADAPVRSGVSLQVAAGGDRRGAGLGRLMGAYVDPGVVFADLATFRELCGLPIVVKGIQTAADARLAVEAGADAIYLSNHGGRSVDTCVLPPDPQAPLTEQVAARAVDTARDPQSVSRDYRQGRDLSGWRRAARH